MRPLGCARRRSRQVMRTPMIACYTDCTSAFPGDTIRLHASSEHGPCRLEIARVGLTREVVLTRGGIEVGAHPTPDHADRDGCGWPACAEIEVGADWASGYYDLVLTDADGEDAHHFVCVKAAPARRRRMV